MSTDIIIHETYYKISEWSRPYSQHTIACEVDMISQYLLLILGYYVVKIMIHQTLCLCCLPQPSASAGNSDLSIDNS